MGAKEHNYYMGLALEQAHRAAKEGNMACGAAVVRDGQVISAGRNTVNTEADPTNHAEMAAIRDACRQLRSSDLSGAILYSTMEPCPMCLWAMLISGVERLVLGGRHVNLEKGIRTDLGKYSVEALLDLTGRKMDCTTGVKTEECEKIRR